MLVAAALAGLAFGGTDQWLGSLAKISWAPSVSLLSAPWLVLAFAAGCSQTRARRGATMGLTATCGALVGYGAATLGPFEDAHYSIAAVLGFAHSEQGVILGGIVTGPLYGLLGSAWRTRRAWLSATLVAGALLAEPAALDLVGRLPGQALVWQLEIAAGLAAGAGFVGAGIAFRRHGVIDRLG